MTGHAGIVKTIGWMKNDEGQDVFRAIVEYPDGPPKLPFDVVWKSWPVQIVVLDDISPAHSQPTENKEDGAS